MGPDLKSPTERFLLSISLFFKAFFVKSSKSNDFYFSAFYSS